MDLLPSNINLVGAELEMLNFDDKERVMGRVLEEAGYVPTE